MHIKRYTRSNKRGEAMQRGSKKLNLCCHELRDPKEYPKSSKPEEERSVFLHIIFTGKIPVNVFI